MELLDESVCIIDGIGPETRSVERIRTPDIRCIVDTDRCFVAHLFDHDQLTDAVASTRTGTVRNMSIGTAFGDRVFFPFNGRVFG